jgi:alpha-L-fucosidase
MSFLYTGARRLNPEFPALDADLKPRTTKQSTDEVRRHQAEYGALVKGQVEELLTRYGKIDLLWFDGKPAIPNGNQCITIERIRELQPGIVINPRLHGHGDFITYERKLTTDKAAKGWAELCNPWTSCWAYMDIPFRANGNVLAEFVTCRALGINYLLGVGPMASGEFCDGIYENMAVLADWMKRNGAAVHDTHPLPTGESASVPATASGSSRFLFALPLFKEGHAYNKDLLPPVSHSLTLKGISKPTAVQLLSNSAPLRYVYENGVLTVSLPASQRTKLVDVIVVSLTPAS